MARLHAGWSYPCRHRRPVLAAVSGGVVYAGSSDGKLYAFTSSPTLALTRRMRDRRRRDAGLQGRGYDSLNADLGDVTAMVTFSIDGTGTCTSNVCGSTVGRHYTVTGTMGTATGTTMLRVSISGAPTWPNRRRRRSPSPVAGQGGVLANAVAVTGNLTVTGQTLAASCISVPTPTTIRPARR